MPGSSVDRHRTRLAVFASGLGAVVCLAFVWINHARGLPGIAAMDLLLGLGLAANAVLATRGHYRRSLAAIPVAGMIVFIILGGLHRALQAYIWAYAMPPLVMAMTGPAWGLGLSGVILLVVLAMMRVAPPVQAPDSALLSIGASFLTTTLLAWLYEHARLNHEAELHRLSTRDDLTGCLNRRAFRDAVEAALSRLRSTGGPVSLILVDVDRFKEINDTWGHGAGDAVLRCLADVARVVVGPRGTTGRIGGDEFAVICRRAAGETASLAETIRRDVERLDFAFGGRVTVTLGVAAAEAGDTVDSLLARADRALYRAKRAGRNAVAVATADEEAPTTRPGRTTAGG